MEYKLTPKELARLDQFPELKNLPKAEQPAFKVGYAAGRYTNLELIVEPDEEGYVQIGLRQNLKIEKLLRSVFGIDA